LRQSKYRTAFQHPTTHLHERLLEDETHQNHTQRYRKHDDRNAVHAVHHAQIQIGFATLLFAKS
jgi:hypothetical protein